MEMGFRIVSSRVDIGEIFRQQQQQPPDIIFDEEWLRIGQAATAAVHHRIHHHIEAFFGYSVALFVAGRYAGPICHNKHPRPTIRWLLW